MRSPRLSAIEQITRTELRRYVQDRVAMFTLVLMPLLIVFLIGSAYGSAPDRFVVGVVDGDRTEASADLVAVLDRGLETRAYDDEQELRRDIRLTDLSGGVVIPAGLADDVASGTTVAIDVVTLQADQSSPALIAAVNGALADEGAVLAAAAAITDTSDLPYGAAVDAARAVSTQVELPSVQTESVGTVRAEDENAFTRAAFSQLVLFVFLNGLVAAAALVQTRRLGIGRRALAAPIGAGTVVSGVAGSRVALGLVQSALLLVAGTLMFGVVWGDPTATAALVLVWAAVAAGAGMLLGAMARTPEQAVAIAVPSSIALAMLGGTFWPLEAVGPAMQVVGHLTPHAWAMDAWSAIVNDGAGLTGITTELAVLIAVAAVLLALSTRALLRTLTQTG